MILRLCKREHLNDRWIHNKQLLKNAPPTQIVDPLNSRRYIIIIAEQFLLQRFQSSNSTLEFNWGLLRLDSTAISGDYAGITPIKWIKAHRDFHNLNFVVVVHLGCAQCICVMWLSRLAPVETAFDWLFIRGWKYPTPTPKSSFSWTICIGIFRTRRRENKSPFKAPKRPYSLYFSSIEEFTKIFQNSGQKIFPE